MTGEPLVEIFLSPRVKGTHGTVVHGSYFGKGTLSASGRGDEKRLEEVEIQIIGDDDGLLCVEIYGTWPVTVKVQFVSRWPRVTCLNS